MFLHDFFVSISSVDDANLPLPNFNIKNKLRLTNIQIIELEIVDVLKILNINKASVGDGISHKMLKETAHTISKPLLNLFLSILSRMYFS